MLLQLLSIEQLTLIIMLNLHYVKNIDVLSLFTGLLWYVMNEYFLRQDKRQIFDIIT